MSDPKQDLIEESLSVLGSGEPELKNEFVVVSKTGRRAQEYPQQGPEGSTAVDDKGNPIERSVVIGKRSFAYRDGRDIIMEIASIHGVFNVLITVDTLRDLNKL